MRRFGHLLEGLRVVELSAFVAAPLGGATLAELGAEVVRIDPPGGGLDIDRWPLHQGRSLYWAGLNQGKKSMTIDTRSDGGRNLIRDLIAHAGTVLTNLPVHGWSSYEALSTRRRDLIMAVITGSPDGSTEVDYTVNAALGFPWITGPEGWTGPVNHVLPAWDVSTGYLAALGLVAAELHRLRTGEGQLLRISLVDVALSVAGHLGLIAEAQLTEMPRGRYGNDLFGSFAHDFKTADDRYIIVVALTPRQWHRVVEATELSEEFAALEGRLNLDFRHEADRFRARREICSLLAPWIAARSVAEIAAIFERRGVLWSRYQTFAQLVRTDPRSSALNPLMGEIDQPGIGRYLASGSPLALNGFARRPPMPAPTLGEDTESVLTSWLGLTLDQVTELARNGVIATSPNQE